MSENKQIHDVINKEYKLGFETLVQSDTFAKGLNEDVIRAISAKKDEPSWLLDFIHFLKHFFFAYISISI